MEIKEAQEKVEKLILHYGDYWEPLSMYARLVEEVEELGRALNIKYGGKKSKGESDEGAIEEEIADVVFIVLAMTNSQKTDIENEFDKKIENDFEKMKGVYFKEEKDDGEVK